MSINIVIFIISYFIPFCIVIGQTLLLLICLYTIICYVILFYHPNPVILERLPIKYLSNGDINKIQIMVKNLYQFDIQCSIIDELPYQLQIRDFEIKTQVKKADRHIIFYEITPNIRGLYEFANINCMCNFKFSFVSRQIISKQHLALKNYPSIIQMQRTEILLINKLATFSGERRVRRIGQSFEFEQIRQYVSGDDYRYINWKATGKSNQLKINVFEEEKSQQVYAIIDNSRNMKMPFNDLSLLDYAINSTLSFSNIVLKKSDKFGLITFSEKINTTIKAENKINQLNLILNKLYNETQSPFEASYEKLYSFTNQNIKSGSIVFLFTNFETIHNLKNNLFVLRQLNKKHHLIVIFFKNSEIIEYSKIMPNDIEQAYNQIIAEKFIYNKTLIVKELAKYGIKTILSNPEDLTVHTINTYLEIKKSMA